MKKFVITAFIFLVTSSILFLASCDTPRTTEEASLTPAQVPQDAANEWIVLFDGTNLDHWHDYQRDGISWKIEDGSLTTEGGKGDIITNDTYQNFELEFEWKISEAGNSGVIYLVQDDQQYNHSFETGPEYQIIDANNFVKKSDYPLSDSQKTGANYALQAAQGAMMKPLDKFNRGKIIVNNGHVEHWLNGKKVVDYELWTDAWKAKVAQTKFNEMPGYGQAKSGHIALQDHDDQVWFRNMRIRRL